MDSIFLNHLNDLSKKAGTACRYTFTGFLSLDELSILNQNKKALGCYTLFGGAENSERVIARFGDPDDFGYLQGFPIAIIKAEPLLKKFADSLSHRDFLGAIMNLGIERKNIGDIIVNNSVAYIFVIDKMAQYILENLTKVKHTVIKTSLVEDIPEGELYKTENCSFIVSSLRLDCIIAAVYNLSRNQTNEIFSSKKVFVNGKLTENTSHLIKENDIISVRGFGRFIFISTGGTSKKGRTYISIDLFVQRKENNCKKCSLYVIINVNTLLC